MRNKKSKNASLVDKEAGVLGAVALTAGSVLCGTILNYGNYGPYHSQ